MEINAVEVMRSLRAFFRPGDVFEIRCLDAVTKGYRYPHTESGYFTYETIDRIPSALEAIVSAAGCYVTANPVNPDLLARCSNRTAYTKRGNSTQDYDIVRRRWLLIDCDAVRPAGISSSEEEHKAALEFGSRIREYLAAAGWPEPILIDSGNGCQMMYQVDLPVDDGSTVAAVLASLSDASTDKVHVDTTTKNLARVWRIPGTFNRKGEDMPSRPHRMDRIISMPETPETVSRESLDTVIGWKKSTAAATETPRVVATGQPTVGASCSDATFEAWVSKYWPEAAQPVVSGGQRKWFLPECPWGDSHTGPQGRTDTYIGKYIDGAYFFKCSHSHCDGRSWDDFASLRDRDWKSHLHPREDYSDVNLDGIMRQKDAISATRMLDGDQKPASIDEQKTTLPLPDGIYDVPGIVADTIATTLEYAPVPNPPLALGGALALMSALCSRRVVLSDGTTPNIYVVEVSMSGTGKNMPRAVNKEMLFRIGMDGNLFDRIGSGPGLEDAIAKAKTVLWQNDECQYMLHDTGLMRRDEKENNSISSYMLNLYTEANSYVRTRSLAKTDGELLVRPHLVLLGSTTPGEFYDVINDRMLRNGLFSRINFIFGEGLQKPDPDRELRMLDLPEALVARCAMWKSFAPPGSGNLDIKPAMVQFDEEASRFVGQLRLREYEKRKELENETEEWKDALWTRYVEMAKRYMLLYACSEASEPDKAVVTRKAAEWGTAFVEWDIRNKIHIIERNYFKSDYERSCERTLDMLLRWQKRHGGEMMPENSFTKKLKQFTPIQQREIVTGLVRQNRLVEARTANGGICYSLPQFFADGR